MDEITTLVRKALAVAPDDAALAVLDQIAAGTPYEKINRSALVESLSVLKGTAGYPSDPASYHPAFWSASAVHNLLQAHGGLRSYLLDARYCCAQLMAAR